MTAKILFVDDEPSILMCYERHCHSRYMIETASSGEAGLGVLASRGPFAVVVSDMRMPGMDGAQFLAEVRQRYPDCVRLLLTGCADVQGAIDVVNRGGVFRFLTKPCFGQALYNALDTAVAQHRLITAERELLDQTLRGAVQVLGEVLALSSPAAFGRALRVQQFIRNLASVVEGANAWEIEVATILSQLGLVSVAEPVLIAAELGKDLTPEEREQLAGAPRVAANLLRRIPRLGPVIEIILDQDRLFDPPHPDGRAGKAIPLGARLLKLARDFDRLVGRGIPKLQAFAQLKAKPGYYDPDLLAALEELLQRSCRASRRTIPIGELAPGMTLEVDLYNKAGLLLLRQGSPISEATLARLDSLAARGEIPHTLQVLVPAASS